MSVIAALEEAGNAASRTSFARSDCGLLVGLPSVVRAPPSNPPIATNATTIAATQAPIVRQGWLALASASLLSQLTFMFPPFLLAHDASCDCAGLGGGGRLVHRHVPWPVQATVTHEPALALRPRLAEPCTSPRLNMRGKVGGGWPDRIGNDAEPDCLTEKRLEQAVFLREPAWRRHRSPELG